MKSDEYISDVLTNTNCDIICLQETWLLDYNLHKLGDVHNDYLFYGKSGVDSKASILCGRPYGGVAILYEKSIAKYVETVSIQSNRVTGVTVCINSAMSVLVLCVYLPCDNYSQTVTNIEYEHIMNVIECTINATTCDAVIVCGDFNTSFERDNCQTRCLSEFMKRHNFRSGWDIPSAVWDYTYDNLALNHRSCIDHFIVSMNVFDIANVNQVIRDVTNPSTHNVTRFEFTCDRDPLQQRVHARSDCVNNRRAWYKATDGIIDNYKAELDKLLSNVNIPTNTILCTDITCTDVSHRKHIDTFCSDIIRCCLKAGQIHIPPRKPGQILYLAGKIMLNPPRNDLCFGIGYGWRPENPTVDMCMIS